ncbi:MAG: thioredoxin family protein [Hyphomicrobiales bacterium]|nr:thioredoxin family protein [Hyphomicrobiales bacterium]
MLKAAFALLALLTVAIAPAFAETGDDGLHKEDWFSLTFRDVGEDIAQAKSQGKRLAIIIEQRGCIYCRQMHEKLLSDPEVRDYIKANYMVVQYNMFGDEEVTDTDGAVLTEKTATRKWGYLFTPTIVFLPEDAPQDKPVAQAAVAVMPGAFGKWTFLDMFKWVREKGYETDEPFQIYHARHIAEARAAGKLDAE